jgi:ABC-2 type transport system permease protein
MTTTQAIRLVARREIIERARDKSFLISTIFTILIVLGVAIAPSLFGGDDEKTVAVATDVRDARALSDAIRAQARLADLDVRVTDADPATLRTLVDDEDADAAITASGAVIVKEDLPGDVGAVIQQAHRGVRTAERLRAADIDPAAVERAADVPPLRIDAMDPPDDRREARRGIAFVGTLLLYGQLVGYGFWVALGIVEEKSGRVVELLLSTISARVLLAGKVLGVGLLGLVQLLLVSIFGVTAAAAAGVMDVTGDTLSVVSIVLFWFVLGYFFYATFFAAAAARVSRQEDLQNVTTPATTLVLISFFAALWAGNNADAPLARVLGLLPPFSALVNPIRVAADEAPLWEIGVAVALMLAATVALVFVAARLYEGAVLRTGGKVSVADAWRSSASR